MNRGAKYFIPQEHEQDKNQEGVSNRLETSGRWPVRPQPEHQPNQHKDPVNKSKTHNLPFRFFFLIRFVTVMMDSSSLVSRQY